MILIGITGTLGAGKGTVVEYLEKYKNFRHYSARRFIEAEITKRSLPINRDTMTEVANVLRKDHSPSYVIEQLFKEAETNGTNAVIESVRTQGEVDFLKGNENFYLLAVDADPRIRYERIIKRASSTDSISYEKFLEDEAREMTSEEPFKQNIRKCVEMADFNISNNGTTAELHASIEEIISKILNQDQNIPTTKHKA